MASRQLPSPDDLRQLLTYDPETGSLHWKSRCDSMFRNQRLAKSWNARYANKKAFTATDKGYFVGRINDVSYLASRIAWTIYHGSWPSGHIDHINRNPSDNRLQNLRDATVSENLCNRRAQSNNACGVKGVSFIQSSQRWRAKIAKSGKSYHLGVFDSLEEAREAYKTAAQKYHGDFANAGV